MSDDNNQEPEIYDNGEYLVRRVYEPLDDAYSDITVLYGSEEIYKWLDSTHLHSPEDLTWSRRIGAVFAAGVELGKRIQRDVEQHSSITKSGKIWVSG